MAFGSSSVKRKSVEAPEKNMGAIQKSQTGGINVGPSPNMKIPTMPRAKMPGSSMAPISRPSIPSPPVIDRMPGPMVNSGVPPMIPPPSGMPLPDMPIPNQMDMTTTGGMNIPGGGYGGGIPKGPIEGPIMGGGIMKPPMYGGGGGDLWGKYNALNAAGAAPMRRGGMFGGAMNRGIFR